MRHKKDRYKVIQWATGNQGQFAIQAIAERDNVELVGVWVSNPEKVGKDAGELAGIAPVGVKATSDTEALLAMDADCIVYSPFYPDLDLMCRMLESGKDLLTQLAYIYIKDPVLLGRLEAACQKGGSTFHASGINPGLMGDRLPVVISTLNRTVKKIRVVEHIRGEMVGLSPEMIFNQMGFGWTQEQLDKERPPLLTGINDRAFIEAGDYIGHALGFEVDDFKSSHDYIMAERPFEVSGRRIEVGQVAAMRNHYMVSSEGVERVTFTNAWVLDPAIETGWGYSDEFYQIFVEGSPSYKLTWHPDNPHPIEDALIGTAMAVVNSIPAVCDAEAGVKTSIDLPGIGFTGPLV